MKKSILLLSLFLLFEITSAIQSEPYRYPVTPGTELWKKTESYADRIRLCNIPDSVLSSMSTNDLVSSVFDFPYSQNLILYDNFLWGFDNIKSMFNGLSELERREDANRTLFINYMNPENENNLAQDILYENLLSLPFVQNSLDSNQKLILLDSCLSKLGRHLEQKSFLTEKSLASASFLMIRILSTLDETRYTRIASENTDIRMFKDTYEFSNKRTLERIIFEIIEFRR